MARTSGDSDDMEKDEVVQTRVSSDIKGELKDRAEENKSTVANEIRKILAGVINTDNGTGPAVRDALLYDLYSIGSDIPGDDDTQQDSIATLLDQHWNTFTDDVRAAVRPPVLDTDGTVYIAGQNSCYAVGAWLTARLIDNGVDAQIHASEDIPVSTLDSDDTVLLISRSGSGTAITMLADRVLATDATVIGMARDGFDTSQTLDHHIPFPRVVERTRSYATRSAILQMALLHTLFLTKTPDKDAYRETFETVDQFIRSQLTDEALDEHLAKIQIEDQIVSLDQDSPFAHAAAALDREGDITDDPVVASLGRYHPLGWIGVQAHTEFLHTNSTHVSLGSVRDAVLNILYRGDAYLLTTIPDKEADAELYDRCLHYLFRHTRSIDNLLKMNAKPQEFEGVAFTFNDLAPDATVEQQMQARSLYGRDSIIQLPNGDDAPPHSFTRDVLVAVAHYLLVYAVLDRRWTQDRQLRQEIERGPAL